VIAPTARAASPTANLEDQLRRAAARALCTAFLVAVALAVLVLSPALALRDPSRSWKAYALPLIAVVLVAGVLGVQVAARGGDYAPRRPTDPCTARPVPPIPARLEPVADPIVLLGLDSAGCQLRISRERLVLALADTPHHAS
jgi:hypothetical protein